MKAAELFIKSLEAAGVTRIFGVPGEENLAMMEAIRTSKIEFVTTRDEQSAAFMAATQGRLTGKAGVAIATLGPGATNLLNGIAYAQLGGMPLLVITGQKPIRKRKQGMFQIIDIVALMRPVTKFTETIVSAHRVPTTVFRALRTAQAERPGAVHLELPEDIAEEESDAPIPPWYESAQPVASPAAIAELIQSIERAKLPMLVIGGGANRHQTRQQLDAFIAKTGMPFATSQLGKGAVDERSEYYLGTAALSANDYVHTALDKSDLLLTVGYDYFEKPPFLSKADRKVIGINYFQADIDEVWKPDLEVVGDIAETFAALTGQVKPDNWDYSSLVDIRKKQVADLTESSDDPKMPFKPQRLAKELREVLPDDGVISLDNGMHKLWIARNYPAHQPNTVLLDNALATMGAGLGVGMGVKLLDPRKKVVCVVGDGGFMMNVADLETAMRLNLDLVIVILNDSGYGMIKWKQADMRLPDFGLDFTNPDFVKLADSFGAIGHRIEKAEDFKPTVQQALDEGGIHIIDLPIDYGQNVTLEARALRARTGA